MLKSELFDILFVGAGPSNLVAANIIANRSHKKVMIFEKGKSFEKRLCPSEKAFNCNGCEQGCHVTEGIGGSSAIHGNKLCYFPASNGILRYFSNEHVQLAQNDLQNILHPYYDSRKNETKEIVLHNRKYYNASIILKEQYRNIIERITYPLMERGLIKEEMMVLNVKKTGDGNFKIQLNKGSDVYAKKVVLGTGRSSCLFLQYIFKELGIRYQQNNPDFGFRIETKSENYSETYYYQNDPKYKYDIKGYGTARTFCAANGGVIVPVKVGEAIYADGAFGIKYSNFNNIALMVRSNANLKISDVIKWCKKLYEQYNNQLLLAEYNNPVLNEELYKNISNIIEIWPSNDHRYLSNYLLKKILFGEDRVFKSQEIKGRLRVYGPCVDNYWLRPYLSENLQTNIEGIYILGDAAGRSRGIVQAITSGATWAVSQVMKRSSSIKEFEWQASV